MNKLSYYVEIVPLAAAFSDFSASAGLDECALGARDQLPDLDDHEQARHAEITP